jgi:hypothetical protein
MTVKRQYLTTKVAAAISLTLKYAKGFCPMMACHGFEGPGQQLDRTVGCICLFGCAGSAQGEGTFDPQLGGAAECCCRQRAPPQASLLTHRS